ncbi:MAG: hypothetical protein WAT19_09795 [Ferruginibacter sp.]
MKKLVFLILSFTMITCSYSQAIKKYEIGQSGCQAYFFCDPGTFDISHSEDSSVVYQGVCINNETAYGIICVKLKTPIADLPGAEDLLGSYMDYLKTAFKIKSFTGYGKGHQLRNNENTRGMIDYWKDEEGKDWKVKGWTDGKYMAVLYAYSSKELTETKVNVFLDGLVLPR